MEKITFKQFKSLLISQPFFVWHQIPKKQNNDLDLDHFWKQDLDYADTSSSQVIMSTFSKITEKAKMLLQEKGGIFLSGDIDSRIEKTKKAFGKNKILINPAFEYNGAIAKPLAYDFGKNIIYDLKFSKKTKRMDFMKAYYQTEIIGKYLDIKDYNFFIPRNAKGKKGIIDLILINRVSLSKGGNSYNEKSAKGELKSRPIMEVLKKLPNFLIKDIDLYVEEINEARTITKIDNSLDKDETDFGFNPYWNELLKEIGNKWADFNGKVISKKSIKENQIPTSSIVLKKLREINKAIITNENIVKNTIKLIQNAKKIVWYDFEGFSLPFPAIDNTKPYQQMAFQLSKIITNNKLKEIKKDNLVWDPANLSLDNLYEIIQSVYSNKANKYIVYNKGYENARLREMAELLLHDARYKEAITMVRHIDDNTIDLMDLFAINSKNKLPAILMHDQKAKSSIKNIEKHISKNKINLDYQIKEYKKLEIQNGATAMKTAIERATGVMGNNEWNIILPKLKEYCENDVKAMIMVYHYILYLVKNS